jgi:hypothetical protein
MPGIIGAKLKRPAVLSVGIRIQWPHIEKIATEEGQPEALCPAITRLKV